MTLDLRQLRAFIAVAEELSFVKAAERLNLAQPALSRTIKSLEENLDVRLLSRTTRSVTLTHAGAMLLAQARLTLAQVERAQRLTREVASGLSGHLDVGYMDFAIFGPMAQLLRNYLDRHPNVSLQMVRRRSDEQSIDVANHRLDAGFTVRHRFNASLDVHLLTREPLVVVLPKGHRLSRRKRLSVAELADEAFILGVRTIWQLFLAEIETFCGRAGFAPRVRLEANEGHTLFAFVALGQGITIYPECIRSAIPPGCVVRDFEETPPLIETFAVVRKGEQDSIVRPLIEAIESVAIARVAP